MTQQQILENWINENKFLDPQTGKYTVRQSDIDKLELIKRSTVLHILKAYKIEITNEDKILESDRSSLVKDHEFGLQESFGNLKNDVPKISKIIYSDEDEIIEEEYEELDETLKNLIQEKSKTGLITDPQTGEKIEAQIIPGNELIKLKLSEKELEYAMNYLSDLCIFVRGIDSSLNDFDNFIHIKRLKEKNSIINNNDWRNTINWIKEYQFIKSNPGYENSEELKKKAKEIRNKIIENNLNLLKWVNHNIEKNYHFSLSSDEIKSFGVEGLIDSIEKFDPNSGFKFSSYAVPAIKNSSLIEILKFKGYKNKYQYTRYNMAKREAKEALEEMDIYREPRSEEIALLMKAEGFIGNAESAVTLNKMIHAEDIDEIEIEDDNDYDYDFTDIAERLYEAIATLDDRQQIVIKMRFGLGEYTYPHTLQEVGEALNLSRERVRQIEAKALRKLRHPSRANSLKF